MAIFDCRVRRPTALHAACAAVLLLVGAAAVPAAAQPQASERADAIAARLRSANRDRCADAGPRCGGQLVVSDDNRLNAWSDGRTATITVRLARFAEEDDALAFVIAHEMAHNLLGHAERLRGVSSHFTDDATAARIRATEIEADLLAIELVRTAGYDPAAAQRLFERMAKRKMPMPASYPSMAQRIALVRMEADALAQPDALAAAPAGDDAKQGGTSMAVRR